MKLNALHLARGLRLLLLPFALAPFGSETSVTSSLPYQKHAMKTSSNHNYTRNLHTDKQTHRAGVGHDELLERGRIDVVTRCAVANVLQPNLQLALVQVLFAKTTTNENE